MQSQVLAWIPLLVRLARLISPNRRSDLAMNIPSDGLLYLAALWWWWSRLRLRLFSLPLLVVRPRGIAHRGMVGMAAHVLGLLRATQDV